MSTQPVFVLPGDSIDSSLIPSHPKKPLRLGPGLRHVPPSDIVPMLAGQLVTDRLKNAIRVETTGGRVRRPAFPSNVNRACRFSIATPEKKKTANQDM